MKITGIVAEYNPFHNGHKYQLQKNREDSDLIVVAMSQETVQRGQFSPFNKWWRAETALRNGADLVVGLPYPVSSQSAEYFADGAVSLLSHLGVNTLSFGVEDDDIGKLHDLAEILVNEESRYSETIKEILKTGVSYPKARELTIQKLYPEIDTSVLNKPNNILGLEYIKSAIRNDYDLEFNPVKRIGSGYHDIEPSSAYMSASGIRESLLNGNHSVLASNLPYDPKILKENYSPLDQELMYKILVEKILTRSPEDLKNIVGMNSDIYNKLKTIPFKAKNLDEAFRIVKSKEITYSAISRLFLNIITDFNKSSLELYHSNVYNPYVRILGFNQNGRQLLKDLTIPTVATLSKDVKKLDPIQRTFLDNDIKIANLRSLYLGLNEFNQDYYTKPIILSS